MCCLESKLAVYIRAANVLGNIDEKPIRLGTPRRSNTDFRHVAIPVRLSGPRSEDRARYNLLLAESVCCPRVVP